MGKTIIWSQYFFAFFDPALSVMIMDLPPLAFTSWMLDSVLKKLWSDGANAITEIVEFLVFTL